MDTIVFLSVITSAFFQASWNFFAKKSTADKISILAVGWLLLGCTLILTVPWTVDFSGFGSHWLYYALASGLIHAFYIALLGWGYNVGEISVVYPVARGLGIFWTTAVSWMLGLHSFSSNGIAGITAIILGVLLVGHKAVNSCLQRKAFLIAIGISVAISLYTLVDSAGAKTVPLVFYVAMMHILTALFVIPFLVKFSKHRISAVFTHHKREAFLIALGGTFSYAIILWAFKSTPVSYIAALREISIVIAALLGLVLLREEISKRKVLGILLVTSGAMFLKWS